MTAPPQNAAQAMLHAERDRLVRRSDFLADQINLTRESMASFQAEQAQLERSIQDIDAAIVALWPAPEAQRNGGANP